MKLCCPYCLAAGALWEAPPGLLPRKYYSAACLLFRVYGELIAPTTWT
jgi:hypothetical protein